LIPFHDRQCREPRRTVPATRRWKPAASALCACLIAFALVPLLLEATVPRALAIFYPEIREPYRRIFQDIIDGIQDQFPGHTESYELSREPDIDNLKRWLRRRKIDTVIALGSRGFRVASEVRGEVSAVVVGALSIPPSPASTEATGITLIPDPGLLFQRLRELVPAVRKVVVIYNASTSSWLIERAREAAAELGLVLDARDAADLREAAEQYRDVLAVDSAGSSALWVLEDRTTMDDRAILPLILEKAWENHLVVFSSSPAHVRRGALFSLYPNNFELGRSLADVALRLADAHDGAEGLQPLRDVHIAVNLRTAEHLGLTFSTRTRRQFDMVFPSP